jgi:predicted AAA+ superfamily ATPase
MIDRMAASYIAEISKKFPVITLTGPRQSGKTTLAKAIFRHLPYVNLENLEVLAVVRQDPQRFLRLHGDGVVIDEVQNFPEIFSYIQVRSDEVGKPGMFVLTGSSQFELLSKVTQSLAGRTALVKLLPFSIEELQRAGISKDVDEFIFTGFYPRIYDQNIAPPDVYAGYFETYIEKDIRQFGQIQNLSLFHKFVKLCAGRIGQILNIAGLANDTGISHTTAQSWLSMLQAGYVIFLLEPYFANISKRLIKSPKLYFYDVGLAAHLMGIEHKKQVETHPLRGNLFENMVVMEILKYRFNQGKRNNLHFYRDSNGNEVDVLYSVAQHLFPMEIKSAETVNSEFFKGLQRFEKIFSDLPYGKALVYGGKNGYQQQDIRIVSFCDTAKMLAEKGI